MNSHHIEIWLTDSNQVWANRQEVINKLYTIPANDLVVIHTLHEGPSLEYYGVKKVIDDWVTATGKNPATITICSPNQYEYIGYKFDHLIRKSHFFKKSSIRYHAEPQPVVPADRLFGYFVGKYTADRNRIAQDILKLYPNDFLMSVMRSDEYSTKWDPAVYAVGSLDNREMLDQWVPEHNTNQSLLEFYNQFEIELVTETFIYGKTFFPTEKTVRPMMGSKPFIINGPVNFLRNLKKQGIETFEELWPEEYDRYEGPERWEHIKFTLNQIKLYGYDRELAQRIVKYNYNYLRNIIEHGSTHD